MIIRERKISDLMYAAEVKGEETKRIAAKYGVQGSSRSHYIFTTDNFYAFKEAVNG